MGAGGDFDARAGALAARWVAAVVRRRLAVLLGLGVATLGLAALSVPRLGVNTDHKTLIDAGLGFQRDWRAFAERFPTLDDALLVVIDGGSPEAVRAATQSLTVALAADRAHFHDVFAPDVDPFFEKNGLLFGDLDELQHFVDDLARIQPILAELAADPTLATLARLVRLGLDQEAAGNARVERWPEVLDGVRRATVAVYAEHPLRISWELVLFRGSHFEARPRRVIVAEPVLDFDRLRPAAAPIEAVRRAAAALDPAGAVRVRLTGNPALNHEEMTGLAWDVGWAALLSFGLVAGLLQLALRSGRATAAAAVTLVVGLLWTASFAAFAVGRLNVVSVAFAVLFLGLGVDFAIHLGAHAVHGREGGASARDSLVGAARTLGGSLTLCTLSTAIGFLCFVPTDFRGVAELGLISGVGMLVILFLTLTLLPALLGPRAPAPRPLRHDPVGAILRVVAPLWQRHPRAIVLGALAGALASLALAPELRFDANVVEMRDPDTESVQAFEDLVADTRGTPWYADVLTPDLASARALAARLEALPTVERAVTLADYVPSDQEEKLALLEEAALVLYLPEPASHGAPTPPEEQVAALRELHDSLAAKRFEGNSALAASARRLRTDLARFLRRVAGEPDPRPPLAELEHLLLGDFPALLERLELALSAEPFGASDLPPDLVARFLAPDGSARVQVFAREDLSDADALGAFVADLRSVAPGATGIPVHLVEFGRETAESLREALVVATLLIAALLFLLWRHPADAGVVLGVLGLGAALCLGGMRALGMSFNFANVIVVPLMLGVGVDGAVHLVQRWRRPLPDQTGPIEPTTARAVLLSLATTLASFGTLALSSHRGLASLGRLLLLGMGCMAFATLVVLPALLRWRAGRSGFADPP